MEARIGRRMERNNKADNIAEVKNVILSNGLYTTRSFQQLSPNLLSIP